MPSTSRSTSRISTPKISASSIRSLAAAAGACLALGALPAHAHAQQQTQAAGRVVRVAGADTIGMPGIPLRLHRIAADSQGVADSAVTGPGGAFRVRFPSDTTALFLLSASYSGIEYLSRALPTDPARPDTAVVIVVADTSAAQPVNVVARQLVITAPEDDGTRSVVDLITLENPGPATRVGRDSMSPSWAMPLPVIGRAAAEALAGAGASVVLGDLDLMGAEQAAAAIRAAGGRALAQRVDVARKGEVDALVQRALDEFGRVDAMCNVAGIPADGPLDTLDEAEFDRVVAVNLKGTLFGCQAAVRAMAPRGSGSIVNVASGAIDRAVPNYGLYALTKAAVTQLTQTLATEVGRHGIRVNALAPGVTLTKFTDRHLRRPDGTVDPARLDAFVGSMRALSPLGLVGEPIDQAWLILYLVSDASRTCTGQIWRANGGQTIPR